MSDEILTPDSEIESIVPKPKPRLTGFLGDPPRPCAPIPLWLWSIYGMVLVLIVIGAWSNFGTPDGR